MMVRNTRDNSVDMARGIAILGVLYGHALAWQNAEGFRLAGWFWSFHMALFALCAGYFWKETNFRASVVGSFRTLIVPLFIVSFAEYFCGIIFGNSFMFPDFIRFVYDAITLHMSQVVFGLLLPCLIVNSSW